VLVSEALRNNEPVLLVGATGCGKTQICQVVAAASGRPLNIYNAHTNTETGDLIGSQRPVRSHAQLESDVLESIRPLMSTNNGALTDDDRGAESLMSEFSRIDTTTLKPEAVKKARDAIAAYRSLFAWSDGSLVRAMKLGEHFLLDEISLADDSVLERLNSVLEPARTIVLAEKGSVDNVVVAHPEFQFVSTMNPGGDYGKRELSAALRNRMTEIWVPPLSQENDVLPIVQKSLKERARFLAPLMLKFTQWFLTTFNPLSSTSIPLRDLLSWTEFINTQDQLPAEHAFVHGASLVFLDSVGANPAGMTASTIGNIKDARTQCLSFLQQLVVVDVAALYNARPALSATECTVSVGHFELKRMHSGINSPTELVFDAPTTLRNMMRIVRALQLDRPVLLEGNPGVGKTAIVTALAQVVGQKLTRINLSDQTDLMDLFGADAPTTNASLGNFSWQDGPLLQAMQDGAWVLLDEMNLASQSVLEGLNSCLDHRKEAYIAELDKTFSCHPNFRLFAAQNPHHQGGGRKGLPASFVNRFTVVYADPFERDDLMRICEVKYPEVDKQHLTTIIRVVAESDRIMHDQPSFEEGGPWEVNLRDVSRWLALSKQHSDLNPMYHFDTAVASRLRTTKQRNGLAAVRADNKGNAPPVSTYTRLSRSELKIGIALLRRDDLSQHIAGTYAISPSGLPAAQSIVTALQFGWPVIVSGPANVGKTELIRSLAATSGSKLVEFSMNADIDTTDLLGGFEQYDPDRSLQAIRHQLIAVLHEALVQGLAQETPVDRLVPLLKAWTTTGDENVLPGQLLTAVSDLNSPKLQPFVTELRSLVDANTVTRKQQFVWNDGILLDAIQDGSWVVLDNANLCNASVLDRLNSLLETDGHLVISEQHSIDGKGPRFVRPHPAFRIFLTTDPKYGELSRAMRNRSLEVYISEPMRPDETVGLVRYHESARLSRLRDLALRDELPEELAGAYINNLDHDDVQLIRAGTHDLLNPALSASLSANNALLQQTKLSRSPLWRIMLSEMDRYTATSPKTMQPFLWLLNEPDFASVIQRNGLEQLRPFHRIWQLGMLMSRMQLSMVRVVQNAESLAVKDLSALERSAVMTKNKKIDAVGTPAIFAFSQAVMNQIVQFLSSLTPETISDAYAFEQMADFRPGSPTIASVPPDWARDLRPSRHSTRPSAKLFRDSPGIQHLSPRVWAGTTSDVARLVAQGSAKPFSARDQNGVRRSASAVG
jgi:midasin